MNQSEFGAALGARLATLSGSPAISWPGIDFDPPADGSGFYEVTLFRNQPVRAGRIAPLHTYPGIYQVAVVWPKGRGPEADEAAQAVADLFPADLKLDLATDGYVKVSRDAQIVNGISTERGWEVVVSVFFTAHGG